MPIPTVLSNYKQDNNLIREELPFPAEAVPYLQPKILSGYNMFGFCFVHKAIVPENFEFGRVETTTTPLAPPPIQNEKNKLIN